MIEFKKIFWSVVFGICALSIAAPLRIKQLKEDKKQIENYDRIEKIVVNGLPKNSLLGAISHDIAKKYCPDFINLEEYKSLISYFSSGDTIKYPIYDK